MSEDKKKDLLGQMLDPPARIPDPPQEVVEYVEKGRDEDDYEYSREGLRLVINRGEGALEELYDLAIRSENVRAFEAIAPTMKSLIDAHKELSLIYEKREKAKDSVGAVHQQSGNTNVLMVTTENIGEALEKYNAKHKKPD